MLLKLLGFKDGPKLKSPIKSISSFLNGLKNESVSRSFVMDDFAKVVKSIEDGIKEDKFLKELGELDSEAQEMFTAEIPRQYELLKSKIPVNMSQDLFGVDLREPSDFEKSKFIRLLRVVHNPDHVLELMENGQLTGTEVDAIMEFYPEYYEVLKEMMVEQIAELQGKDVKLDRAQNQQVSLFLGVPRINPESFARLQANLQSKEQEESGEEVDLNPDETVKTDVQQVLNPA